MRGQGPSFGAQARAAELNAAAAARARNGGEDPQGIPLAYNATLRSAFADPATVPGAWISLGAGPPQYVQGTMEHRPPPNCVAQRATARALSASATTPRAAHPLRNVTTIDAGLQETPMVSQATIVPPSTSQKVPGVMGPDDISPAKQEEKHAARGVELQSGGGGLVVGGGDPFVSAISDYSATFRSYPYQINTPPMHEYPQWQPPVNPISGHVPGYHNTLPVNVHNRVVGSDAHRQGPFPHSLSMGMKDAGSQHFAERDNHRPGQETQGQQHAQSMPPHSSADIQYSTPTRSMQIANSESLKVAGSAHGTRTSSVGRARLHNDAVNSSDSSSPLATRRGQAPPVYNLLQGSVADVPFGQRTFENPLRPARAQSSVQPSPLWGPMYDADILRAYMKQPVEQSDEPDAFDHLPYYLRPVPWIVTPKWALDPAKQNTRNPPPGLPLPDPEQDNIVQPSDELSEIAEEKSAEEEPEDTHSEDENQEHLRRQIATTALEDRTRRLEAGSSEAEARRAEETSLLLGNILVNLQSYVIGRPSKQAANFANFGEVPERAVETDSPGHRSYFDTDPSVDPPRLSPWRSDKNN